MSNDAKPNVANKITRRQFNATAAVGTAAAALSLAPAVAKAAEPQATLRAGAGERKITPLIVTEAFIIGPNQMATGVHDDLFARTLVLEQDGELAAIVTADLVVVHMGYNDEIVDAISKSTGIPADRIVINTNHTHSAPLPRLVAADQTRPESWQDTPYSKWLLEQIVESAKDAVADLRPAQMRAGRETTQVGMNRRYMSRSHVTMTPNPHGAIVPWVDTLGVYTEQGKRIALLFSAAAHPVIIHGASRLLSGDFPGIAVHKLRHRYSRETGELDGVIMFAQGCGANINGHPLRGGIAAAEAVAGQLDWAVARAQSHPVTPGKLRVETLELQLPFQAPPSIARCQELVDKNPNFLPHQDVLEIAKSGKQGTLRYPIRGFSFGKDLCILTLSHEPFCEYQLFAVDKSPFKHTLVFGYTHGVEQYIATRSAYELGMRGGYEASPHGHALHSKHRLALQPQAADMIEEGILKVMKKLQA